NDPAPAADAAATALARFEGWVARAPGAPAVAGLTYGELDARANGLAWRLRQPGIAAHRPGALAFDPPPQLARAPLRPREAGAAYLSVDPAAPPERLAFMVADTGAPLVITRPDWVERFAGCPARTLVLDGTSGESVLGPPRESNLAVDRESGEVACVIYTSG